MARAPHALPARLGTPFRTDVARAAGVSRKRMRARDLEIPFRGVRQHVAPEPTLDERPLAFDRAQRARVMRLAQAYAQIMGPLAFFAGRTAAVIHGLPVQHGPELEVAVFSPARPPRRKGVRGRKVAGHLVHVDIIEGLRVASPASCWAMLGGELSERDLVRLGDAIVCIPRGPGGQSQPHRQLASVDELRAAATPGRPGRRRLLSALDLVRVGSMSPLETDIRVVSIDAGLPEPELDVEIRDATGRLVGISDIRFPDEKVLVEGEGDHHRTDPVQWARDIERLAAFAALGYETVRITSAHLRGDPPRAVELIRAALRRGAARQQREADEAGRVEGAEEAPS